MGAEGEGEPAKTTTGIGVAVAKEGAAATAVAEETVVMPAAQWYRRLKPAASAPHLCPWLAAECGLLEGIVRLAT